MTSKVLMFWTRNQESQHSPFSFFPFRPSFFPSRCLPSQTCPARHCWARRRLGWAGRRFGGPADPGRVGAVGGWKAGDPAGSARPPLPARCAATAAAAAVAAPLIHGPRPPDSGKCGETKPLSQSDSQQLSPRDKDALGLGGLLNSSCPAGMGSSGEPAPPERQASAWAEPDAGHAVAGPAPAICPCPR